jgi:hypothetical protein
LLQQPVTNKQDVLLKKKSGERACMKLFQVIVSIAIMAGSLQDTAQAWWPFSTQETTKPIPADPTFDAAKQQHAQHLHDLYVEHKNNPSTETLAACFAQSLGNNESPIQTAQKRELYKLAAAKAYKNNDEKLHEQLDYQTWTIQKTVWYYGVTYGIPVALLVISYICYKNNKDTEKDLDELLETSNKNLLQEKKLNGSLELALKNTQLQITIENGNTLIEKLKPTVEKLENQIDKVIAENKRLAEENKKMTIG